MEVKEEIWMLCNKGNEWAGVGGAVKYVKGNKGSVSVLSSLPLYLHSNHLAS